MSYANVIMYGAVLPSYHAKKKDRNGRDEKVIKADDPRNKEAVRRFFETCN